MACVCPLRLHEQMVKMNQSLHRLQVTWQDAQRAGSPLSEQLLEQFERLMIVYLSTKAATTQPAMLQCCLNLQASTAALLVQLSMGNQGTEHVALSFPLASLHNTMLCYVPGMSEPEAWLRNNIRKASSVRNFKMVAAVHVMWLWLITDNMLIE